MEDAENKLMECILGEDLPIFDTLPEVHGVLFRKRMIRRVRWATPVVVACVLLFFGGIFGWNDPHSMEEGELTSIECVETRPVDPESLVATRVLEDILVTADPGKTVLVATQALEDIIVDEDTLLALIFENGGGYVGGGKRIFYWVTEDGMESSG